MVGRRLIKKNKKTSSNNLDKIVQNARINITERDKGYREQSLKIHPWVCGRCGKEYTRENLQMLTVHHVDHNHDNNPVDGSNWENLCIYCHDREHQKLQDYKQYGEITTSSVIDPENAGPSNNPFANLKDKMNNS